MSDNLLAYIKGLFCFDAVVQRTDPARWEDPSPCDQWTARGVVNHNARVCFMIAEMTRGNPAAVPAGSDDTARLAPSQDGFVMAPHLALARPFVGPDDDPVAAWNPYRDDVLRALDQPGALEIETRSPWGHRTVDAFLGFAFVDPLIHSWDLAKAVGQVPVLDAGLAEHALDHLTQFGQHKELRQPIMMTDPVPVGAQDPVTRLIAFSGRQP